jgi:hypothetical protein
MVVVLWPLHKPANCNLRRRRLPLVQTSRSRQRPPRLNRSPRIRQRLRNRGSPLAPTSLPRRPRTSLRPLRLNRLPRLPRTDLLRPRLNRRMSHRLRRTSHLRLRTGRPTPRPLRRISHPLLRASRAMFRRTRRISLRPRLTGRQIHRQRELLMIDRLPQRSHRQTADRRRREKSRHRKRKSPRRKKESRRRRRTNPSLSRTVLRGGKTRLPT